MKTLDRYVLKEMVVPLLIGSVAIALMFQANMLIALFKNLNMSNVPAAAIGQLILFKTPFFLNMTLPSGMALASSLALSRLTRESELTAMRSAGISVKRVLLPVLIAGLLVAVGDFLMVSRLLPRSERAATRLSNQIGVLALAPQFKSNVVVSVRSYTAFIGSVSRGAGRTVNLNDIVLLERRSGDTIVLITSPIGVYKDGEWLISKPIIRTMQGDNLLAISSKETMPIKEKIVVEEFFQQAQPEERSITELVNAIRQAKMLHQDTASLEIAYHLKFSVPIACAVFALTGSLLAIRMARSGPFVGVLLSIMMVLLYFNVYVISTEIFGRNGWVPPWLAAWLPDILFACAGLLLLRRAE